MTTTVLLTGTGVPFVDAVRAGGFAGEVVVGRDLASVTVGSEP